MNRRMQTSTGTTARVRDHFRAKAFSFDALYDEEHALQRKLRPGLFDRRDLALALGYFDYIEDAVPHVQRIAELLDERGSAVASFPRWTWTKGPVRKLRYEVINNCPIFDYTEDGLRRLFGDAGLTNLDIRPGKSGFLVRARRPS